MTDVLRQKLRRLFRDEDGVALVVTLALFMFLYVSCAGVFAVGRAVKGRVLLQNAADVPNRAGDVELPAYGTAVFEDGKRILWGNRRGPPGRAALHIPLYRTRTRVSPAARYMRSG